MIELHGVQKRFGEQVVLDGVDFTVQEGETVALLGPSGTGKSVLLKHIIGLIRPDEGTVIVDDKTVARLKRKELAALRAHIGYVFQNGALFDSMNVFENVRLGITDEEKYRDLDYRRSRVLETSAAGEPGARDHGEVPGPALGRHAEARGHRAGHRGRARSTSSTTSPPPASIR